METEGDRSSSLKRARQASCACEHTESRRRSVATARFLLVAGFRPALQPLSPENRRDGAVAPRSPAARPVAVGVQRVGDRSGARRPAGRTSAAQLADALADGPLAGSLA